MLTVLRELVTAIIGSIVGMLIYFGIPSLVVAVIALVFGVEPESNGGLLLLLLLVVAVWMVLLMNPPSWLEQLTRWLEK